MTFIPSVPLVLTGLEGFYAWMKSELPTDLSVTEKLEREPATVVMHYKPNDYSCRLYVIPQQLDPPIIVLLVKYGDPLPEGLYFQYEGRTAEIPTDTPVPFKPSYPFPAVVYPRQYRILHTEEKSFKSFSYKGRELKGYVSSEIALVVYTTKHPDINAARFLTKAAESDFDRCRVPGAGVILDDPRRVTEVEIQNLVVDVRGLPISPKDLVLLYSPGYVNMFTFPVAAHAAPIVLLMRPNCSLPSGRVIGNFGPILPKNVRIPFVPLGAINAKVMYHRNVLTGYKLPSYHRCAPNCIKTHQHRANREICVIIKGEDF